MKYSLIADTYEKIESTSKRLEMTDYLRDLIKRTPRELLGKVAYLTQGKLYPDFFGIEMGLAEKSAINAIAKVTGMRKGEVIEVWHQVGDLGSTVENMLDRVRSSRAALAAMRPLEVNEVYCTFNKIARISGEGSVEAKLNLLTELLGRSNLKEAKYIIRTVTGNLRLGIGDMTFLDALAVHYGGGKEARKAVERAYNMSSDLGLVAQTLAEKGMKGIECFRIMIGRPIRPMLCERLTSSEEVLKKLSGKGAAELKYDGLRIQAHISPQGTFLFSRRLENLTGQFPDIIKGLKESVTVREAVVEGECVAIDPDTNELQPFQIVTHRRGRKHGVETIAEKIPVQLILFDILYMNGITLVDTPYIERRKTLENVVAETESIKITHPVIVEDPDSLNVLLKKAIENGCEGLVIKSLKKNSIYQAGARGFLWIKYKREYQSEMVDTIDLVVIGAFAGRGRRVGTYGALLMATYEKVSDTFKTICKIGTGFSDEELSNLPKIFEDYRIDHPHPRVDSNIQADYWFIPKKVLEVRGAELTVSPSHTSGWGIVQKNSGLAIRFPRFTGRWREDKSPEDATTVKEIIEMYHSQLKRIK